MGQAKPAGPERAELGRYRQLGPIIRFVFLLFTCLGALLAIDYIFVLGIGGWYMMDFTYYFLLMGLLFPFVFLLFPVRKGKLGKIPWYDWLAATLAGVIPIYFSFFTLDIIYRGWEMFPPPHFLVMATILCLIILEATRRVGGLLFFLVVAFFFLYPLTSGYFPGAFKGVPFEFPALIGSHAFGAEGLMGIPMKVLAEVLIGFLLLAGILIKTGAGDFFLNLALAIAGRTRGGPAKVSIISSAFFGSLSGSVFSNIVATGSITIPIMKRTGYPAHYAGAVEACASTGGVLMPPVMGAAAFIMASLTEIPYSTIMVAAFIPSILYYGGLLLQTDAYAARTGLRGLPKEEVPAFWATLKQGWHFLFVIVFLVFGLVYMKWAAMSAFYASALLIVLSMVRKDTRIGRRKAVATVEGVGQLFVETAGVILPLGLVVNGLVVGGMAPALTASIVNLSGGVPFFALLMGTLACYVLGMVGMLTPAYIFLAITLAPVLINMGFNVLAVHLFIIYYAMLSTITPPVAVGAFLAAGIAGARPMRTAWQAMRLGIVIYFVPFFFVFEPAFVLQGALLDTLLFVTTCALGILFIAGGIEGYLLGVGRLQTLVRPFLAVGGMLIAFPDWQIKAIGAAIAIPLLVFLLIKKRALKTATATT